MSGNFSWFQAATVFAVYVLFDILYALYVMLVGRKKAFAASLVSSALYSLGAYGVMTYLENPWYLAPLALGAFVGTYLAVRYMGGLVH
jgi:uncharacterized membrane protein YfcA